MRIAIVGSHGVGKTSLMDKLQNDVEFHNYTFFPEVVREVSRLGFPYNEQSTDYSQLAILAMHLLHLHQNDEISKNFVTDRFIVDSLIYAQILKNNGSDISEECIKILDTYWQKYKNAIDLYVFCPAEWDIKDDKFRMTNTYMRDMISTLVLAQLYGDLHQGKFLIVHGTTEERVEQVKKYLKVLKETV